MLRDRLIARLAEMGDAPGPSALAAEVLGIRGAPPELARRLVAQALVLEDRRETWRRAGERICRDAPATPGVYVLKDAGGRALYVGKAVNLRRRLRAHFADAALARDQTGDVARGRRRMARGRLGDRGAAARGGADPRAAAAGQRPDRGARLDTREVPRALVRDVLVLVPSVEADSVELIGAAVDGRWMIQRTRRNGADLAVHTQRLMRFFNGAAPRRGDQSPWRLRRSSSRG